MIFQLIWQLMKLLATLAVATAVITVLAHEGDKFNKNGTLLHALIFIVYACLIIGTMTVAIIIGITIVDDMMTTICQISDLVQKGEPIWSA